TATYLILSLDFIYLSLFYLSLFFLFFLLSPPPPSSTLFPYTTLFRSSSRRCALPFLRGHRPYRGDAFQRPRPIRTRARPAQLVASELWHRSKSSAPRARWSTGWARANCGPHRAGLV